MICTDNGLVLRNGGVDENKHVRGAPFPLCHVFTSLLPFPASVTSAPPRRTPGGDKMSEESRKKAEVVMLDEESISLAEDTEEKELLELERERLKILKEEAEALRNIGQTQKSDNADTETGKAKRENSFVSWVKDKLKGGKE